jgi:hypothetical protein
MSFQHLATRGPSRSAGVLPPPRVSIAVRDLVISIGDVAAAAKLGLNRTTVVRVAGRMPCHRGTVLLAARALGIDLDEDDGARP